MKETKYIKGVCYFVLVYGNKSVGSIEFENSGRSFVSSKEKWHSNKFCNDYVDLSCIVAWLFLGHKFFEITNIKNWVLTIFIIACVQLWSAVIGLEVHPGQERVMWIVDPTG